MAQGDARYTRKEISVMTDDALDELLSYYQDKGNTTGALMVADELGAREDDRMAEQEAEMAHEAEQERQQIMHDEWLDYTLAQDGRWG